MIPATDHGGRFLRAVGTVIIVCGLASAALAHDHEPPRVVAFGRTKGSQVGRLGSACWIREENGSFGGGCGYAPYSFPRLASLNRRVRLVISKSTPPQRLVVQEWRKLNDSGSPAGDGRAVPYELRPDQREDRTRWVAFLRLSPARKHFIGVHGEWADEEGCVNCPVQSASWEFSVRTE